MKVVYVIVKRLLDFKLMRKCRSWGMNVDGVIIKGWEREL